MNNIRTYIYIYLVGGLESRGGPIPLPVRYGCAGRARVGVSVHPCLFAMALEFPPSFASCVEGNRMTFVAKLDVWDMEHEAHRMTSMHEGVSFYLTGLLDGDGHSYTLVNAEFRKQFPVPWVVMDDSSRVFRHDQPSWQSLHQVVELCSGFGGMHQGMTALGFGPVVAVDANEKMMKLYSC